MLFPESMSLTSLVLLHSARLVPSQQAPRDGSTLPTQGWGRSTHYHTQLCVCVGGVC